MNNGLYECGTVIIPMSEYKNLLTKEDVKNSIRISKQKSYWEEGMSSVECTIPTDSFIGDLIKEKFNELGFDKIYEFSAQTINITISNKVQTEPIKAKEPVAVDNETDPMSE